MKKTLRIILLNMCLIILSSFVVVDKYPSEYIKLQKFELQTLKENVIGKTYVYDLTGKKNCNKTKIKYLGVVHTNQGKLYKILTSFFVFSTNNDMCHGTSKIKIYNMENRFVGEYYVSMPESLPDSLIKNKLLYKQNSDDCNLRKLRIINLSNGLPKTFFIPCSENGGDEYSFNNGD